MVRCLMASSLYQNQCCPRFLSLHGVSSHYELTHIRHRTLTQTNEAKATSHLKKKSIAIIIMVHYLDSIEFHIKSYGHKSHNCITEWYIWYIYYALIRLHSSAWFLKGLYCHRLILHITGCEFNGANSHKSSPLNTTKWSTKRVDFTWWRHQMEICSA